MSRALLLLLIALFCLVAPVQAAPVDPGWEEMLDRSAVILKAEVVEGGESYARVKALKTFKGPELATPTFVDGFNDPRWEKEALEIESFKTGELYYLFLKREPLTDAALRRQEASVERDPTRREYVDALKAGTVYSLWTASAGELPVVRGKVHYSLLTTSYARHREARSPEELDRFLEAALRARTGGPIDEAFQQEAAKGLEAAFRRGDAPATQHYLLTLHLIGDRVWRDLYLELAHDADSVLASALARQLGRIKDRRAEDLLILLLTHESAVVQNEVVQQLAGADPAKAGPILLERLKSLHPDAPEGSQKASGSTGGGDRPPQGETELIHALGRLRYQPAAPTLRTLLAATRNELSFARLVEALDAMGDPELVRLPGDHLLAGHDALAPAILRFADERREVALAPAIEHFLVHHARDESSGDAAETLARLGAPSSPAAIEKALRLILAQDAPTGSDAHVTADLIRALASMRHGPARAAIQDALFYWYGIEAGFGQHPELLDLKRRLEAEISERVAKKLPPGLQGEVVTFVFLENRAELAADPKVTPKLWYLVKVQLGATGGDVDLEGQWKAIARAARVPKERLTVLRWGASGGSTSAGRADERMRPPGPEVLKSYLAWSRAVGGGDDVRFLKLLVDRDLAAQLGSLDEVQQALQALSGIPAVPSDRATP